MSPFFYLWGISIAIICIWCVCRMSPLKHTLNFLKERFLPSVQFHHEEPCTFMPFYYCFFFFFGKSSLIENFLYISKISICVGKLNHCIMLCSNVYNFSTLIPLTFFNPDIIGASLCVCVCVGEVMPCHISLLI